MDVPAPSTSRLLLSPGPVSPAAASHIRTALSKVDEFWGDEAAIVQARAAKRSAASKQASEETERGHTRACSACRKGKIRCLSTSPLETCPRCQTLGLHCDYPEPRNRGPKKRLSKTHRLLRDIRRELEAALAEKPVIDPLEDGSDEEDELRHDDRSTSDEVQLLRNPLAILAEQACEASSPISPGSAAGGAPVGERYYEASLYLSRPESNFALDPVTAGILNLEELDRLIRL
ncbi:hypothetical protein NBRC10513_005755 [Rhodotorula toruloides]|uniref:RemN protein n=1 Tax=Rhodotorula toruloides TaxID=5286 RepID=A0A2T0A2T1_RHOTO|nr:RemN protein [Rhodotorula toruloides]